MSSRRSPGRPASPIRSLIGGLTVVIALTGIGCAENEGGGASGGAGTGAAAKKPTETKAGQIASDDKDIMKGIPKKDR